MTLDRNEVLEAARTYHARGWQPIHIAHQSKRPSMSNWPTLRPTADDLDRWFIRPANVGILLGAPSGWLVDVDLDCPETVALAPRFLPPTLVFGRRSKLRSHWLFIAAGATTKKRADAGKMLVEMRSTGAQTVFPPSVHESGEPIEFDCAADVDHDLPRRIEARELNDRVLRMALAAVLVRAGWSADDACARALRERGKQRQPAATALRRRHTGNAVERAIRYLNRLPEAIDGQGGHLVTWNAAQALVRGFALPEDEALALLATHYNPRCRGPWTLKELQHKVEDAAAKSTLPPGYLLNADWRARHV